MLAWLKKTDRRLDAAAYVLAITVALWAGWQAADLVWAFWVTGVASTLVVLVAPWLLLTFFPRLSPGGSPDSRPVQTRRDYVTVFVMLAVLWGTLLAGYTMAGIIIIEFIPLPGGRAAGEIRGLPEALVVSLREYWMIVLVNLAHQAWPVWREIRRGGESPTNPFVSLGRVLVVCTVMVVLFVIPVNTIVVVALLFLFYIPDDVFAERVLGMH